MFLKKVFRLKRLTLKKILKLKFRSVLTLFLKVSVCFKRLNFRLVLKRFYFWGFKPFFRVLKTFPFLNVFSTVYRLINVLEKGKVKVNVKVSFKKVNVNVFYYGFLSFTFFSGFRAVFTFTVFFYRSVYEGLR